MKIKQISSMLLISLVLIVLSTLFLPSVSLATGDGVFDNFNITLGTGGNLDTGTAPTVGAGFEGIIVKYRTFIVGLAGVAAVTMVALFIVQFIKLGQSAGNPQARSQALAGVLWTGVAAAGLGSVSLITALFYKAIAE